MALVQKQFFSTYAQLISLSSDAPADSFYGTEDYSKLESLGPTLPKIAYALPKSEQAEADSSEVVLNVKSIRPPFKFSTQLSVSVSQTVYKVKSELAVSVPALKEAGVTAANLKLMVKAKVLSDTTVFSSLASSGDELAITVMVSPPAPVTEKAPEPVVSGATWLKIYELVEADIGPERAKSTVEKFKSV